MSAETLIKVEGVSKKFCRNLKKSLWYGMKDLGNEVFGRSEKKSQLRNDEFWAVKDVSFELKRGECLGLIGRNGAGKTTLLRMLNGLIKPDQGRIEMQGRVGAMIALGAGFNPVLTGRENIYVNASMIGLTRHEIDQSIDDIIDFAEVGDFIDSPVQSYSSGMQVRLGFSIASTFKVDVLLLDEVLAVGDTEFRTKCFKRIGEVLERAAVIFVSHNEAQVRRICNLSLLLNKGIVSFVGNTPDALSHYRNTKTTPILNGYKITDDRVTNIKLIYLQENLSYGDNFEFRFHISISECVTIGFTLIHFANESGFVAHSQNRFSVENSLRLERGFHELRYKLGPVYLTQGKYQLCLSLFNATGKKSIAQLFYFANIDVSGSLGSGPPHLIPMRIFKAVPMTKRK